MRPTTGDSSKSTNTKAVALTEVPLVTQAQLKDINDLINSNVDSQKQTGAVVAVRMTTGGAVALAVAQGTKPADPWTILGDTAASPVTSVTPA